MYLPKNLKRRNSKLLKTFIKHAVSTDLISKIFLNYIRLMRLSLQYSHFSHVFPISLEVLKPQA
jgi:hypothetical protein